MTHKRRWEDRHRVQLWAPWVVAVVALLMGAWSLYGWQSESQSRLTLANLVRDQNCLVFEGQHLTDVEQLRSTYAYLETLPRSEWGSPLNAAIVRGLDPLEKKARMDSAPEYCDEPNLGLPEPDPRLPPKRDFTNRAEKH